ncbi:MAG: hypothetical protein ABI647_24680 [Gemmatimonadota bacterium]
MRGTIYLVGMVLAAACNMQSSPVPVRGNASLLVGEWSGEYQSSATGRAGSIVFTLQAGRDTAFGDVLMIPVNYEPPADNRLPELDRPRPQLLRISFVGCEATQVTGWLDPYTDPATGETIYTSFEGSLNGDVLKGTFDSRGQASGKRYDGKWRVKRRPAKS